ncbi:MAG TPA: universal stress protein [Geminicoccaceae bacterium]|nr:universal stress protein [Geminicoccaceae bacterium]
MRQILLATDLSARCDRAFDRAVLLAREAGARLTIATALERSPDDPIEPEAQPRWRQDDRLADAECQIRDDLEGKDVDARIVIRRGRAGELIVRLARENAYDLIVTGIARSTGLTRMILGSTVEAVLRERVGPVLVVKQRVRGEYRTILIGTDFSEAARAALRAASDLFPQARLTVLHAYQAAAGPGDTEEKDEAAYQRALEECATFVAATQLPATRAIWCVAEAGLPETLLNQYARDAEIDLLAVGTQGRHPMLGVLFGSTCAALVLSSPRDTLLVPKLRDETPAADVG